jgi:hypothetical protein
MQTMLIYQIKAARETVLEGLFAYAGEGWPILVQFQLFQAIDWG